jgi:hypothetical protein
MAIFVLLKRFVKFPITVEILANPDDRFPEEWDGPDLQPMIRGQAYK